MHQFPAKTDYFTSSHNTECTNIYFQEVYDFDSGLDLYILYYVTLIAAPTPRLFWY